MTDQFSGVIFFEAYDFYNTAEYTNLVSGRTPKKMNAGTPDGFTVICPIGVDTLSVQKCVLADWCLLAIYVQGSDPNFCVFDCVCLCTSIADDRARFFIGGR